ncbi:MAG: heme-binding domain-containing protein [Saprospiraceae bacterium]
MQFLESTRPNQNDEGLDIFAYSEADQRSLLLYTNACYDCHSYETVYPWYVQFAPVSWFMKHHIDEGRHHVNFSTWGDYPDNKKSHKLEECIEMINEGEMPLSSYVLMHSEAKWTDEEKSKVLQFFKSQMDK